MKITAIQLNNIRSFKSVPKTILSHSINVFIGANNAGKSTILNSIFLLQKDSFNGKGTTIGQREGTVELYYSGEHLQFIRQNNSIAKLVFTLRQAGGMSREFYTHNNQPNNNIAIIPELEPQNLIYPYLSKRKVVTYIDVMNEPNAKSVSGNFTFLYSKVDRLVTPQFPGNKEFVEACNDILGFQISSLAVGNGKQPVYIVDSSENIPLSVMGEGVANILGLIVDLCIAENKIFLIEELENDIHPKALKALLKLIIEKSETNQFFISTHSNIVMKYLGSVSGSKIFNITNDVKDDTKPNLRLSKMAEVSNNPEERRRVLEDLGYDFFDFDLWTGWLFLEESSAEIIIREYLTKWFVPTLKNKVRTFSAGGTSNISPKFDDFDKLFIFLHLEEVYKNKVWVLIDGGEEEGKIIQKMKDKYAKAGWNESNFNQFKEHDFEKYYPAEFQARVNEIIKLTDKQTKRLAKKALLDDVKNWIAQDEEKAKEEFKESAKEVIEQLKQISKELNK